MANDMMLARGQLPEGWIDLAIGEPEVVRKNLITVLNKTKFNPLLASNNLNSHIYPPSEGVPQLVEFLKQKHGYKYVVITVGAKQGISAALHAVKGKRKSLKIYVPTPYWLSFPALFEKEGVKMTHKVSESKVVLLTDPNNPDGKSPTVNTKNKTVIFDGAYHSQQYLAPGKQVEKIGDIQIFSFAKMYGLSGLRVGYVCTDNQKYFEAMREYMEIMTMGVSTPSQYSVLALEEWFQANKQYKKYFNDLCLRDLGLNRIKLRELNKDILDTSEISRKGMFAFLKKGKEFDKIAKEAKVAVVDGEPFGQEGYVRINLAVDTTKFSEAINNLNSVGK